MKKHNDLSFCLLYTSDAADERSSVDLGGRRIIKKKKKVNVRDNRYVKKKNKASISTSLQHETVTQTQTTT